MMKITLFTLIMVAASLGAAANVNALPSQTFVSVAGNDAQDCTLPTPCRTFDGALPKTAIGGEITALDSGTYGAVDINKSITIQATFATYAQVTRVTINGDDSTTVILRNLQITRVASTSKTPNPRAPKIGINFKAGVALHVENCVLSGFPDTAIAFNLGGLCDQTGCPKLFMNDVISRNNSTALRAAGAAFSIDHCRFENNSIGVDLLTQTVGTIQRSVIAGNFDVGLQAPDDQATVNVENCGITDNGIGIQSSGVNFGNGSLQAIFYVSNTLIAGNKAGLAPDGGQIISYGNNQLANNLINGAFTSTITQQ